MKELKNALRIFLKKIVSIFSKKIRDEIEQEFWGGLIWIWETGDDYIFWASISTAEAELRRRGQINRQVKYEYNQWAQYETRNWCTVYSAVTEVSWLMDYEYSLDEILVIGRKMIKDGKLNPDKWAYLHDAIDYVRKDWNERMDKKIVSYRIDYSDKELRYLLTHVNPRLTQLWYRTSSELYNEIQSTWIANKKDYKKVGWHAVSQWWLATINNYKGKMVNWVPYRNRFSFTYIDDLIKNDVIFKYWYMFLKA